MDIRKHGNMLLQSLAPILEITGRDKEEMVFDRNNECFLTFEDKIVLMFYLDEDLNTIIINSLLGILPQDDSREEIMYELLCGNYCWNLSEGGTLGVDRETAVITLGYFVDLPLEPVELFEEIIAKLVNVTDYWIKKLSEIQDDYAGSTGNSEVSSHFMRV
jgi:hypothetical protein